jgi:ABC-2 type transport system ATP-binding protein
MLARAAALLTEGRRDDETLALELPYRDGTDALRALLDRLDASSIEVEGLAVHPAELDDVFLSLTGDRPAESPLEVPTR